MPVISPSRLGDHKLSTVLSYYCCGVLHPNSATFPFAAACLTLNADASSVAAVQLVIVDHAGITCDEGRSSNDTAPRRESGPIPSC